MSFKIGNGNGYPYRTAYSEQPTPIYTNYDDKNCKMNLYNSNNNLIPNINYPNLDTTISLNPTLNSKQYNNIYILLRDLEIALNNYTTLFTPYALFEVSYDYSTKKVNIKNKTGAKFGIGFDFLLDGPFKTAGGLHKVLGFEQKVYLGLTEIESIYKPLIFEDCFADDYLLICSDLLSTGTNYDINVLGIGNSNPITTNNRTFAIPLSKTNNFRPNNPDHSMVEIVNSNFSVNYNIAPYNNPNTPIPVNFYLRLLSGRHIQMTTQWVMTLKIEYGNN